MRVGWSVLRCWAGCLLALGLCSCAERGEVTPPPVTVAPTQLAPREVPAPDSSAVRVTVEALRGSLERVEDRVVSAEAGAVEAQRQGERLASSLRAAQEAGAASVAELAAFREQAEVLEMLLQQAQQQMAEQAHEVTAAAAEAYEAAEELRVLEGALALAEAERSELRSTLTGANEMIEQLSVQNRGLYQARTEAELVAAKTAERAALGRRWFYYFWGLVALEVLLLGGAVWWRTSGVRLF